MNVFAKCCLALILAFMSGVSIAKEPRRIDGTSEKAFDKSFSKVVKKLSKAERRTFALGLFGALLSEECLSTEAIVYLTFSPVTPKDGPLFNTCREQLDGMSYQDVLDVAEPPDPSQAELPNKSFKADALKGAA